MADPTCDIRNSGSRKRHQGRFVAWAPLLTQDSFAAEYDNKASDNPSPTALPESFNIEHGPSLCDSMADSMSPTFNSSDSTSDTTDESLYSTDPTSAMPQMRISGSPIRVTVGTGQDEVAFHVHENLLCSTSGFFKAALTLPWQESRNRSVPLPTDDPRIFAIYYNFLYEQRVFPGLDRSTQANRSTSWYTLASAWILGDRLADVTFKDAVIDAIIETTRTTVNGSRYFPVQDVITFIYDNSIPGSTIRKLVVDQHTYYGESGWLSEMDFTDANCEFLLELATSLLKIRTKTQGAVPDKRPRCYYHEHNDKETCLKCRLNT